MTAGASRMRSALVVPASSAAMLPKATGRGADEVVIDLEDAVVPAAKDEARAAALHALRTLDWSAVSVAVRVNGRGTPWGEADLAAFGAAGGPLRAIVLPKAESAQDIAWADALLEHAEAGGRGAPLRLQGLIETARGVAQAEEVAGASPRLEALILGYADLAVSLGRSPAGAADVPAWDPIRDRMLVAARAHDLRAIDGPWLGLAPDERFRTAAERARDLGFDGKWAIHPAQIPTLNELFTPTGEQVAWARAVVEALAAAEREGRQGAVALDGQMLDEPVRLAALRVLATAGEAP